MRRRRAGLTRALAAASTIRPPMLGLVVVVGAGCVASGPTPLVSEDSYRFGVASRKIHRDLGEVEAAAQEAMKALGYQGIHQDRPPSSPSPWATRFDARTTDGRRVQLDLDIASGSFEGSPLPLRGLIAEARVTAEGPGSRELSTALLDRIADQLRAPRGDPGDLKPASGRSAAD